MDAISNTICSVIDAADFVRNAHADQEFRDAADEAFSVLAEYIQVREPAGRDSRGSLPACLPTRR